MRIHTNSHATIVDAAVTAGVTLTKNVMHGSRTHPRAFEVNLEGSSTRRPQSGPSGLGSGYAATWDEWGMFLAAVFAIDPLARTRDYECAAHFHWATTGRYHLRGEVHGDPCRQHKWSFSRDTDTASIWRCTKCDALMRRLNHGLKWKDVQ